MPHIHYLYDYTVSVYIVNKKGQLLLVNHPRYNKWIAMGGHIELDEDPEQALFREIAEETGLEVTILSNKPDTGNEDVKYVLTPNYIEVHEGNLPHKHIAFVYFALAHDDKFIKSSEHTDMKWFTIAELDEAKYNIIPNVKYGCKKALSAAKIAK